MVLDAVSNFVRGRADAQLTAEATTLSVEDASIFPDPATDGEFNLVIWDANNFPRPDQDSDVEIVRVTGRDTGADELTVVRAQETTSDVAHPEGSAVHLSPTAKMFSDIEAEYTAQGENFDGQGTSEFENLQSVSTEDAVIENWSQGYDAVIFQYQFSDGLLGAINSDGELIAGGPDAVNVSDPFDFGEILPVAMNLGGESTSSAQIKMAPAAQQYQIKTTADIGSEVSGRIHLFGPGKNRGNIVYHEDFNDEVGIDASGGGGNIWRFDSIKFEEGDSRPDVHVRSINGPGEFILTHCEFRDANEWGFEVDGSQAVNAWNSITDCWFLRGAGLKVHDQADLRIANTRFFNDVNIDLQDIDAFREAANEWQSQPTFTNVGEIPKDTKVLTTTEELAPTTSNEYESIGTVQGGFNIRHEDDYQLYGKLSARGFLSQEDETATVVPEINEHPTRNFVTLNELELEFTETAETEETTGWVPVTSVGSSAQFANVYELLGKVTGGEFTPSPRREWALAFEWRL